MFLLPGVNVASDGSTESSMTKYLFRYIAQFDEKCFSYLVLM